jgi:predicted transcriptional regulator YdeE
MANQMNVTKLRRDSFEVVGIEGRTTNAREMGPGGLIPQMWTQLGKEHLLEKIPHRLGSDTIVLYTDYESDKDGAYTYVLGAKVSEAENVPAGMVARSVPAGEYAAFVSEDRSPQSVVSVWQRIWKLEDSKELRRAYKTDVELHKPDKSLEVYVGVKE